MASSQSAPIGTFWIRPLSTNRTATSAWLKAYGIRYRGFDHQARAYVGCKVPAAVLPALHRLLGAAFQWGEEPDAREASGGPAATPSTH
jgi:hypothetical protein